MSLFCWIALGLIAGFAGRKLVNKNGEGLAMDVAAGVSGSVVGGLLFNAAWQSRATEMNVWSLSVAAIGSAVVLWVWHAFIRRA